jgi:hypothetical protein
MRGRVQWAAAIGPGQAVRNGRRVYPVERASLLSIGARLDVGPGWKSNRIQDAGETNEGAQVGCGDLAPSLVCWTPRSTTPCDPVGERAAPLRRDSLPGRIPSGSRFGGLAPCSSERPSGASPTIPNIGPAVPRVVAPRDNSRSAGPGRDGDQSSLLGQRLLILRRSPVAGLVDAVASEPWGRR